MLPEYSQKYSESTENLKHILWFSKNVILYKYAMPNINYNTIKSK